jgi:hypothetical protein
MEESHLRNPATKFVASAYLRRRRKELQLSLRRKFGRRGEDEAQEGLISEDQESKFNDEELEGLRGVWFGYSLSTRLVLIVALVALSVNIFVMIGFEMYVSSIAGSVVACMVGVAQLRLEDLESKTTMR